MSALPKIAELLKQPEKMRVMCAEACGIRPTQYFSRIVWAYGGLMHDAPLPYDTSLDAMAEAEATLTDDEKVAYYCKALPAITGADLDAWMHIELPKVASATAIQRLAGFLIAKGLAQP